jgi:hypothetical protein
MIDITRRNLLQFGGAALASFSSLLGAATPKDRFYFAVIADTHIVDDFYKGPENSSLDTDSILKTTERLTAVRTVVNGLQPAMDRVFLVGDYFHDYPSTNIDFYFQNKTRIDRAKELTDGFRMPVHAGFGNHDYAVPKVSRDASHELFRRKLNLKPYYSVDHKGWKFVHLNNFLGATWDSAGQRFDRKTGSLGEEQLNWFEAELEQRKPTFVFIHFPLIIVSPTERADYGLHTLLKKHRDTVQRVISGHWHKWFEFGRSYGPQHLVIAATRYDPNAYLIVEADTKNASHRLLNLDGVDWNTHYSKPFQFSKS